MVLDIVERSWGPEDKFDAALVARLLKENGYEDLPFTAKELLYCWGNPPKKRRKRRG